MTSLVARIVAQNPNLVMNATTLIGPRAVTVMPSQIVVQVFSNPPWRDMNHVATPKA